MNKLLIGITVVIVATVASPVISQTWVIVGEAKETDIQVRTAYEETVATVTAYTCDVQTEKERAVNCPNGITAMGTVPHHERTVACDKALLGKEIHIDGLGKRVCEDTGGAIIGTRVDVYVASMEEALSWGVQKRKIRYEETF